MFDCMLDMFNSDFRCDLLGSLIDLYLTLKETPSLLAIYKDEVKVAVELIKYLLLYADGELDRVFELDLDEKNDDLACDLAHEAYGYLYKIYKELD